MNEFFHLVFSPKTTLNVTEIIEIPRWQKIWLSEVEKIGMNNKIKTRGYNKILQQKEKKGLKFWRIFQKHKRIKHQKICKLHLFLYF